MNARLSSLLVAGGVVLAGIQSGSLKGALPDAGSPATSVTLDGASMLPGDAQVLKLSIPGFSGVPIVQVLDHPQRIVVDLPGVNRGTKVGKGALKGLGCPQILRSRMAQFAVSPQPVTRLVLEVAKGTRAEVSSDATGVSIRLNAAGGPVVAQMVPRTPPVVPPVATAAPAPSLAVAMTSPTPEPVSGPDLPVPAQASLPETVAPAVTMAAPPTVSTPEAVAPAPMAVEPTPAPKAVEPTPAPKAVEPTPAPKAVEPAPAPKVVEPAPAPKVVASVPEAAAEAPKAVPETASKPLPVAPKAPLAPVPATGSTFQALPALAVPSVLPAAVVQERSMPRAEARSGKTLGESSTHYTGAKITVDVPGADLQTFLRIIAETAHLNLVADTDVQGVYTFKFVNTPWDQVLDVILKHVGLGKEISNGVIRVARIEKLQKEEEDRKKLEDAKAIAGELQSITCPLSFAKAADAKNILDKVITKRGSIIIDERTNTLIISDLPRNFPLLYDLIAQLDVKIQQVQIEARVVEASKNWERDFGAKWPTSNSGDAKLTVGGSDAAWGSTGAPSWNSVNNLPSPGGNAAIASYSGGAEGVTTISNPAGQFWISYLTNRMSVNVILQALEKDGVVKVVSSPKVVTQNNKKAKVLSGSKIPYPATQAGNNTGAISVQFADANLELEVTPQITNDGTILMDIHVEKSDADFGHLVGTTPTITHKEVNTQVLVKDGGTAIMGGVYKNNNTEQSTGVPFLNKLPLIGFLFRNKVHQDSNDELLIFITPRILNN